MFKWLTDWYLDRLAAKEQASLPAIHWQSVLETIGSDIGPGSRIYLETRDRRFVPANPQDADIVSLIVTWSRDGLDPWKTKEQATTFAQQLAENKDLSAVVLLSRDPESFAGYYVRIRAR